MECPACDAPNVDGARYCAKCGALLPPPMVAGDEDPLIGQVVGGRFRITGLLGEGGMGRVYTGEQQMGTSIRKVAVKTLLTEFSSDPQVQARFMRECGTVSELEHPNTIKFHDFGQTDSQELYIAMEYVDGKALSDIVEAEPLSAERVDKIMKQISGSLHEAHDKGIIHRDLKPENVILTTRAGETDFVKVLDFGIAKRSEASDAAKEQKLTQAGMVLGTLPYMSPEQFTGKELDNRSDIYSLGVMAYEMLTSQLPFKANTPWEWATQHMTAQPFPFEQTGPMAANIPPLMKTAILRSLSKDADQRQDTAKQFYAELSGAGGALATGQLTAGPAATGGGATEAFPSAEAASAALGVDKPGATQIGEPMVPPGGGPPGMATGPSGAMGGPPGGGMATGPSGAMGGPPAGASAATGPGPMGGGTPAPMTPSGGRSSGGGGPPKALYAGIGAVVVLGVVLALVFGLSGGDETETDPDIIDVGTDTSAANVDTGSDSTDPTDTGTAVAETTSTTTTTPKKYPPRTYTKKPPTGKLTPTQYCNSAIAAARAKRCGAAKSALSRCRGAKLSAARANVGQYCR